nr:WG repeat-containing protein [uncultured Fluviicola sp.]
MKNTINSSFTIIFCGILVFFASCSAVTNKNESDKTTNGIDFPDNSGLYPIIRDSLYGYINAKGEEIIKPQFERAAQFSEGLAYFEKDGKYGFINPKGEVVIQPIYTKKSHGWLNISIEPMGESFFKEGVAAVNKDGLFGYINQKGEEVIPARFSIANPFCQGFAHVRDGQKTYFINQKGENQFGRDFEWAMSFNDSLALVKVDGKTGYINTTGKMVIPANYYTGGMFVDGYAVVKETRESKVWKLIDKKGKVQFEKPYKMNRGAGNYVYFSQDLNEGLLNLKGEIVIPAKYDMIIGFMDNVAIAKVDSKEDLFGLINKKGEWIIQPTYESLFPAGDDMIMVATKNRELGYIDFSGKVIWKPTK